MTHPTLSSLMLLLCLVSGCTGEPERAHAASPSLELGARVPDEALILQDGFELRLPAMKGKLIAVFFCASLDDPQCQREAKVFGEHHAELRDEHHVVIIGVSPASSAAHKSWLAAQHLPLDFASDRDGRVARAFGASAGSPVVVVDKDSTIRAVWRNGDPERHVRDLLAAAR
jgi:peroxiredoxin